MEGCFQTVPGKNKFVLQFEDGKKKYMSDDSWSYVCDNEEVVEAL